MIEFHESEYSNPALSDRSMRLVALFIGPVEADKLRYAGDKYAGLHSTFARNVPKVRTDLYDSDYVFDIFRPHYDKEPQDPAEVAQVPALADSG